MIQLRTMVKVADNTGAKLVQIILVLGGSKRKWGQIGDLVVGTVKIAEPRKVVKKSDIVKGVIVRQVRPFRRKDGSYIKFDENAIVILDGKEPKGGRIFGPIPKEIKDRGFSKIASLAQEII